MGFASDVITSGFSGLKNTKALKLILLYFIVTVIISSLTFGIQYFFVLPVMTQSASSVEIMGGVLITMIASFCVSLFSLLFGVAISYLFFSHALNSKGRKNVPLNLTQYVLYIVLSIAQCLFVLLSLFRPKYLLILVAAIILFFLGVIISAVGGFISIIGSLLLIIGLILGFVYIVVIFSNTMRLLFSDPIFVESKKGIVESLKASWDMTKGHCWKMFGTLILLGIISGVIYLIAVIPLIYYMLQQMFAIFLSGIVSGGSGVGASSFSANSTVFFLSMIPAFVMPFLIMVSTLVITGMYDIISKGNKGAKIVVITEKKITPKRSFKKKK
ncbi:MAG: glycerophosphoryl diester phosphodiesterase membrane domain-containing protein [Candidatus Diapherotrites archaeon]|nr:glycerophosphoryl diester phosphodiesterase membrane domain-containing protein [Candidatus Diapherotrites archaeon]